jgi:hypothetical protein
VPFCLNFYIENIDILNPILYKYEDFDKLTIWKFAKPFPQLLTLKKNQDVYPCELTSFSNNKKYYLSIVSYCL